MEEGTKSKDHLISAAAFVEGGTQDACDDACSICLEAFSENDPHTVTGCKHEFHLQCILEWCQRSSQCPMCWQSISLKDPSSQELLDAIEQERSIANNPALNATIFHHPTFGDFELQHLPVGATDSELEERIIQHLAAAAAMGRARHMARREGHRTRTSAHGQGQGQGQGRPRFLGFSAQPSVPSPTRPTASGTDDVQTTPTPTPTIGLGTVHEEPVPSSSSVPASSFVSTIVPARPHEPPPPESRSGNQDRAGPSEAHSFSDFKTRVNAISLRYKDSITKTTKSWKERLFSRNNSAADDGSKDRGEGSATLSRMMDHLQQDLGHVDSTTSPRVQNTNNSASRNEITGSAPAPAPSSGIE
ncbi:E3 ubiquitin-protein ligase RHF2A isoform X1 [Lactuca sativa]|uniref:E3 ubiquitin-protein ligase RHF2A isoform X1 n=1 Tax=Lactuca sativa TaxID=4236 RepID=UPI000CD994E7|nr:E3 ubiquitin-protein ligase RHF2A isoform X1 [Lactuca sativa]XP_023745599.1 E3 ubiquitin-protein ligase RHF2A isoform X1 [Lactuca sativa]XP_042755047.1 E3 ubiquitin-protein ligase RHF2A isoform X1 [Lactuca sativa]XP_042755048.1 E3 ubiquitin-protein ligase RHF2A isoform X1 [Lactuca sativa]